MVLESGERVIEEVPYGVEGDFVLMKIEMACPRLIKLYKQQSSFGTIRIFVRGHKLFQEANSFPRTQLKEKCELQGIDNVQGQN